MIPLAFDLRNCVELIPDDQRRILGMEARMAAETGKPPRIDWPKGFTYWDGVMIEHTRIYWQDCYNKRKQRLRRLLALKGLK